MWWGMWGESGLPGEEDVETEAPPAIVEGTGGRPWRDDVDDERCSRSEPDRESVRTPVDSRIRWNLERATVVFRADDSRALELIEKDFRSFFFSRSWMKSLRLLSSSIVGIDPELPSLRTSEPRCADDDGLGLPLLLSSSVLGTLLEENRLRRWLKLLLKRAVIGAAGLGELEPEDAIAVSLGILGVRKAA